jgi:hypothetical protein
VQMCELLQRLAVLGIHALDKGGIVELRLAIGLTHISERMQALHDGLAAHRRQLLPARKQILPHVPLLLGSHLLPHMLPLAQVLLLCGRESVPGPETLADLRLLLRRQILETLVILQELLLPFGRHILQTFDRFRRQPIRIEPGPVWTKPVCCGTVRCRPVRQHLFTPQLSCGAALLSGRLHGILANGHESLAERGTTRGPCQQQSSQNSAELEPQFHYLVSFAPSLYAAPGATPGVVGNSESTSNLETTS